ncbi:hypothetical protein CPAV1605_1041 [seawater metagenome]|uniref:Uncharacterized protein n=1 Tax=seawater metagenome TaxID=1561972 RepID=A0A5E8CIT4_9ZZZZ
MINLKQILIYSQLLIFASANSCNFDSVAYCGHIPGIVDQLEIKHIDNNSYDITAEVLGSKQECVNETLLCSNNTINYPTDSKDCLKAEFDKYNLEVKMNYDSKLNLIDVDASYLNFKLKEC